MKYHHWILIFIILCITACTSHRQTYRQTQDSEQLRLALLHEIKTGDRIEHIQRILGSGKPASEQQQQNLLAAYHRWQTKYGDEFKAPDGIATTDFFLFYPARKDACNGIFLQFRYGRLINHDRNGFQDPDVFALTVNLGSN